MTIANQTSLADLNDSPKFRKEIVQGLDKQKRTLPLLFIKVSIIFNLCSTKAKKLETATKNYY